MSAQRPKGPAKTTPKHGKSLANRLYSKIRRGNQEVRERDNGINPDGTIEVAAVCGREVSVYAKVKAGRRLLERFALGTRGAALLYAADHDDMQRAMRARAQG